MKYDMDPDGVNDYNWLANTFNSMYIQMYYL